MNEILFQIGDWPVRVADALIGISALALILLLVLVIVVADAALIARALIEERVLSRDVEYQAYCRRVVWHLVPGGF